MVEAGTSVDGAAGALSMAGGASETGASGSVSVSTAPAKTTSGSIDISTGASKFGSAGGVKVATGNDDILSLDNGVSLKAAVGSNMDLSAGAPDDTAGGKFSAAGATVSLSTFDQTTGDSGDIAVLSGTASDASSGSVTIKSGGTTGAGSSGSLTVAGGSGDAMEGAPVLVKGGDSTLSVEGIGGSLSLDGGAGATGGEVSLRSGSGSTSRGGAINVEAGSGLALAVYQVVAANLDRFVTAAPSRLRR